MIFNATERDGEGNYVDFKYVVPCDGYYTMTFKNDNGGRFYGVDVEISQEPDLTGGFRSRPGRYLAAVDRAARRVHLGALPSRLYIGVSGEDCAEIMPSGENTFSSVVSLKKGGITSWRLTPRRGTCRRFLPTQIPTYQPGPQPISRLCMATVMSSMKMATIV